MNNYHCPLEGKGRLKNYSAIFLTHYFYVHLYNHKGSGSQENNGHSSRREDSRRRETRSQREERRNVEEVEANGRMMMRGQEVDSTAVSIFTDMLVELTNTVWALLWYFDEDLVYQEVEVEEMVEKSEKNLSRKWKNTLTSVSAVEKMRWAAINLWSDVEVIIFLTLRNLDLQIDGEFQITSKTKKVQMEVGIECTPTIMQKKHPNINQGSAIKP